MKYDLSIIIPSRNEQFLKKTVEDILKHKEGKTEIIIGLDGEWAEPQIQDHPDITILHYSESIGQRGITNQCVRLSSAKYIMKVDAHCSFDKGFDIKMITEMRDNWTMVPVMRNLHAFDWICKCGHKIYQGPTPKKCEKCGNKMKREMKWIAKTNPQSKSYCFDSEPHFQYFKDYTKTDKYKKDLKTGSTETMSLQGSCWMLTRKKYWELDICDEEFGSWGSQGIEVAVKTWLSGGRVVVNHKTWYAHLFRTQGGDFGFPYQQSGRQVQNAKKHAKDLFFNDKWDKAVKPLYWLVKKFMPVKGWTEEDLEKIKPKAGIVYYTDNQLNMRLARTCRKYIQKSGLPIVSVSLKPLDFGKNIHLKLKRSPLSMFKQILAGLKALDTDIVFFAEHDVLYHPSHFDFIPENKNTFYYNGNYWFLRMTDGFAIHYNVSPLSGLCGYRKQLIKHFEERVAMIEKEGFSLRIGYEPMTHNRIDWKNKYKFEIYQSKVANIDLCHEGNMTKKRWSQDEFRKKPTFWEESKNWEVPGWDLKKIL